MEFQGQRGDPLSAWSVGKYAKRSATIHLNSKDLLGRAEDRFEVKVIEQNDTGILVEDTDLKLRTHLQTVGNNTDSGILVSTPNVDVPEDFQITPVTDGAGDTLNIAAAAQGNFQNLTQITQLNGQEPRHVNDGPDTFDIPNEHDGGNTLSGYVVGQNGAALADNVNVAIRALGGIAQPANTAERRTQQLFGRADGAPEHAMFLPKGVGYRGPRGGTPSRFRLADQIEQHHFVAIPISQFPRQVQHDVSNLQHLRIPNIASYRTAGGEGLAQNLLRQQIMSGYRLELFYSSNVQVNPEGNGLEDNNAASNWQIIFTGVPTQVLFRNVLGIAYIVLRFSDDPRLTDLSSRTYDNNRYSELSTTADGHANEITVAVQFARADTGKAIRWNLRQMPRLVVTHERFAAGEDHCNYTTTIPNVIGYPEHKRCLIQVQSLAVRVAEFDSTTDLDINTHLKPQEPLTFGVYLDGNGVQNVFTTVASSSQVHSEQLIGVCHVKMTLGPGARAYSYHYINTLSLVDSGVLASSPFGRDMRVRIVNLTTHSSEDAEPLEVNKFKNNPTHVTLRLLFLDDDDLPMR
eukprot:COSAG06_NODE_178_length_20949_cov_26.114053_4_plen_575_part_00